MKRKTAQLGLTLVEMLIALTIFGVLAVSCMVIQRLSINSDEQLKRSSGLAGSFHIARTMMKDDLAQIVERQTREEFGRTRPGPVVGGSYNRGSFEVNDAGETLLLSLVRNGRQNPGAALPRSTLQYVEYRLRDRQLVRRTWPYTDILEETPPLTRVLYDDLENVEIRFLDGPRWVDQWQSRGGLVAPSAVELSFEHPVFGPVTQLFYVGQVTG